MYTVPESGGSFQRRSGKVFGTMWPLVVPPSGGFFEAFHKPPEGGAIKDKSKSEAWGRKNRFAAGICLRVEA